MDLDKITELLNTAQTATIELVNDESGDTAARQAAWKDATAALAEARLLADHAKIRKPSQRVVRELILGRIDTLTKQLREVEL